MFVVPKEFSHATLFHYLVNPQLSLHLFRPTGRTVRMDYYVLCLPLLSFLLYAALSHGSATLLFFPDSDCQDPAPSTLNGTDDGRCIAVHEFFGSFEIDQITTAVVVQNRLSHGARGPVKLISSSDRIRLDGPQLRSSRSMAVRAQPMLF